MAYNPSKHKTILKKPDVSDSSDISKAPVENVVISRKSSKGVSTKNPAVLAELKKRTVTLSKPKDAFSHELARRKGLTSARKISMQDELDRRIKKFK